MNTENEQVDQYNLSKQPQSTITLQWTLSKKETIRTGINPPSLSIERNDWKMAFCWCNSWRKQKQIVSCIFPVVRSVCTCTLKGLVQQEGLGFFCLKSPISVWGSHSHHLLGLRAMPKLFINKLIPIAIVIKGGGWGKDCIILLKDRTLFLGTKDLHDFLTDEVLQVIM